MNISPLMSMGLGILGSNQGNTPGQAFGNAVGGGFQTMMAQQQAQQKQRLAGLQSRVLEWQLEQMAKKEAEKQQWAESMAKLYAGQRGEQAPAESMQGGQPQGMPSPYDGMEPQTYGYGQQPGIPTNSPYEATQPAPAPQGMGPYEGNVYQQPMQPDYQKYLPYFQGPYAGEMAKGMAQQMFPEQPTAPSAATLASMAFPGMPLDQALGRLYEMQNQGKGTTVNVGPGFDPKTAPAKELFDRLQLVQTFGENSPQVSEFDRRTKEEAAPTAEQAGRRAMMSQMSKVLPQIEDAILPLNPLTEKREVDRALVATMQGNVPFSNGRLARARIEDALQTKLRLETGAQANESEIENILQRFLPSIGDSEELIKDKIGRLKSFADTALKIADPELYKNLKERATGKGGTISGGPDLDEAMK